MALGAGFRIRQQASNGGRGLKTTKVQAFGGSNPSTSAKISIRIPQPGAVVADAIDDAAADFYRHFGFGDLAGGRLWGKLSDIRAALELD